MTALYVLSAVTSSFGALMSLLLVMILQRLSKLEDKLDGKQDKPECERCEQRFCQAVEDIWDVFNKHSHEGLRLTSKVTR
jgi:hypothetical protein